MLSIRRLVFFFFIYVTAISILFQTIVYLTAQYSSLGLWSKTLSPEDYASRNEVLGVAVKIYVISLQSRTDRREQMELLRESLGLRWTYVEGMDIDNEVVDKIMSSVRSIRAANSSDSSFIWPESQPSSNEWISPWSPEFLTPHEPVDSAEPMLCATQNNTIARHDPELQLPEYRFLTHGRIACWYSHLSVIQSIANDPNLNATDSAIVLEDDVDMERDIQDRLEYLWDFLPVDWDMVYLGGLFYAYIRCVLPKTDSMFIQVTVGLMRRSFQH